MLKHFSTTYLITLYIYINNWMLLLLCFTGWIPDESGLASPPWFFPSVSEENLLCFYQPDALPVANVKAPKETQNRKSHTGLIICQKLDYCRKKHCSLYTSSQTTVSSTADATVKLTQLVSYNSGHMDQDSRTGVWVMPHYQDITQFVLT